MNMFIHLYYELLFVCLQNVFTLLVICFPFGNVFICLTNHVVGILFSLVVSQLKHRSLTSVVLAAFDWLFIFLDQSGCWDRFWDCCFVQLQRLQRFSHFCFRLHGDLLLLYLKSFCDFFLWPTSHVMLFVSPFWGVCSVIPNNT